MQIIVLDFWVPFVQNTSTGRRRRRGQSSPPRTKGGPSGRQKGRVPNNSSLYVIRTLNNTRVSLIFVFLFFLHKKATVNTPHRSPPLSDFARIFQKHKYILRDVFSHNAFPVIVPPRPLGAFCSKLNFFVTNVQISTVDLRRIIRPSVHKRDKSIMCNVYRLIWNLHRLFLTFVETRNQLHPPWLRIRCSIEYLSIP